MMGDLVPRGVRQIPVLVHQHPRHLLEEAATGSPALPVDMTATENRRGGGGLPCMRMSISLRVGVIPTLPRFVVEEATTTAPHPAGKAPGRNPIPDPIAFLFPRRRAAEPQISQPERPLHELDVPDLAIVRTRARAVPLAGVLDHHKHLVVTHDRSDRTVPKQVGQAYVDVGLPRCHRIHPIFSAAGCSTSRIECRVIQRPGAPMPSPSL